MQTNITVGDAGSMLMGGGLAMISTQLYVGVGLITFGVALKVLVAVLNKQGIEVKTPQG